MTLGTNIDPATCRAERQAQFSIEPLDEPGDCLIANDLSLPEKNSIKHQPDKGKPATPSYPNRPIAMSETNQAPSPSDCQQQIAQLTEALESLNARVKEIESKLREDHRTLEEDHRKIESLEQTSKVSTRPLGL